MSNDRKGEQILVLGAGNFGTCLAQHLAEQGYNVTIWTRSDEVAESINQSQKNPKYLSSITLSERLTAITKIDAELMSKCSVVLQAVPAQAMRSALCQVSEFWRDEMLLICAAKGIEVKTLKLPSEIIAEELGEAAGRKASFISGPSFAIEVANRQPTGVTVASLNRQSAQWTQELFHAAHFRVYTSEDPVGVEVAGALKNVIAIAAGATVGIGFQQNSRATLITRGLAEITRVGVKLGANPQTFNGLSGVGDLFLTCTSEKSRNFTVGYRLGKGENLGEIQDSVGSVAEGVATAQSARDLCVKLKVDAPILEGVYKVLYENQPITQAVMELVTREAKPEIVE